MPARPANSPNMPNEGAMAPRCGVDPCRTVRKKFVVSVPASNATNALPTETSRVAIARKIDGRKSAASTSASAEERRNHPEPERKLGPTGTTTAASEPATIEPSQPAISSEAKIAQSKPDRDVCVLIARGGLDETAGLISRKIDRT